ELRRNKCVIHVTIPANRLEIAGKVRQDGPVHSAFPMADRDRLLDANSRSDLHLRDARRLAMRCQLLPTLGRHCYTWLRPEFWARRFRHDALCRDAAHPFTLQV